MKKLTILRGLPGSGKTEISKEYKGATICTSDKFWSKDGEYTFDVRNLNKARSWCFHECYIAMTAGAESIVIDDNNIASWEYLPYIRLGEIFEYDLEIIEVKCDLVTCVQRNIKKIPLSIIKSLDENYEETLIPYKSKVIKIINQ